MMSIERSDSGRWSRILFGLHGGGTQSRRLAKSQYVPSASCTVKVLDRESEYTVTVSWVDPVGCRYEAQLWRRGVARRSGVCALSGQAIHSGDDIYRPGHSVPRSVNCQSMILADVLSNDGEWIQRRPGRVHHEAV